jgi:hypothetical protein
MIRSPKHYLRYCYYVSLICTLIFLAITMKSVLIFTTEQALDTQLQDPFSLVFKYFDENQNARPIMDIRWGNAGKCLVTAPTGGGTPATNKIPTSYAI